MSRYTEMLEERAFAISPEDDDYEKQLLQTASLFRPFDKALDDFLARHGYSGDSDTVEARVDLLRERFQRAGIQPPRGMRDWFARGKRPERDTAFQICFAFGLDLEETGAFFREVCLDRGFDCHMVREAVYYYCIRNGLTFGEAEALIGQIKKVPVGRLDRDREILYTGAILEQLDHLARKEDLVRYLNDNLEKFRYNNATATSYIRKLWGEIAGPDGLAAREGRLTPQPEAEEDRRITVEEEGDSVWTIYAQILGLDRYQRAGLGGGRSIKAVLRSNALLHPVAEASFPDRDGINKALNGAHISNERMRKLLILLVFYAYWAKRRTERGGASAPARIGDADRCLSSLNRYLLDAGYPELYPGNPYDWIFLWALRDDYPLEAFRSYIGELFAVKSEQSGEGETQIQTGEDRG